MHKTNKCSKHALDTNLNSKHALDTNLNSKHAFDTKTNYFSNMHIISNSY